MLPFLSPKGPYKKSPEQYVPDFFSMKIYRMSMSAASNRRCSMIGICCLSLVTMVR